MIQEVEYLYAQQRSVVDGKKGAKCPQWEEEEGLAGVCPTSSEPSVHKPYSAILCHSVSHCHTYTHVTIMGNVVHMYVVHMYVVHFVLLYSQFTHYVCHTVQTPCITFILRKQFFSQRNDDGNVKRSMSG